MGSIVVQGCGQHCCAGVWPALVYCRGVACIGVLQGCGQHWCTAGVGPASALSSSVCHMHRQLKTGYCRRPQAKPQKWYVCVCVHLFVFNLVCL